MRKGRWLSESTDPLVLMLSFLREHQQGRNGGRVLEKLLVSNCEELFSSYLFFKNPQSAFGVCYNYDDDDSFFFKESCGPSISAIAVCESLSLSLCMCCLFLSNFYFLQPLLPQSFNWFAKFWILQKESQERRNLQIDKLSCHHQGKWLLWQPGPRGSSLVKRHPFP